MQGKMSELFKRIAARPLLIPAIIVFLLTSIYLRIFIPDDIENTGFCNKTILILQTERHLDGKNSYIAKVDDYKCLINSELEFYPGDRILVSGLIENAELPTNPGEFDYKTYIIRKGINGFFKIENVLGYSKSEYGFVITRIRYFIRDFVFEHVKGLIGDDVSLIGALCLGDSSMVDSEITKSFRLTNCSHLLAVSGSHFSSFLVVLPFIFSCLGIDQKRSTFIYIFAVLIIGFMTGWTESVTRASVMSLCGLFMRDSISGMAFASLIMIIGNPYASLSMGFQMSYCACFGILGFRRKLSEIIRTIFNSKTITDALSVTLSSQLGMLIFASGISMHIGIIPLITSIVGGMITEYICVFFVLGLILSIIYDGALMPSAVLSKLLKTVVTYASKFSYLSFSMSSVGNLIPVLIMLLLILYLVRNAFLIRKYYKYLAATLSVLLVIATFWNILERPDTRILFIDVGQGDSCLIMTSKYTCLIDSGVQSNGLETIPDILDYYSIGKIDFAIMTHWDEDHGGGMMELLKEGRVDRIYTSYVGVNDKVYEFLINYFEDSEISSILDGCFRELHAGDEIRLSDNDILTVLWPSIKTTEGDNPESLVLEFDSYGYKTLFTGDIDENCEKELVDNGVLDDINLLKVAHHGSKYSSSLGFLKAISAEDCVISVGEKNFYGHPAPEVITRLGEVEANIYLTSKNGAIIVNISKDEKKIASYKENKNAF